MEEQNRDNALKLTRFPFVGSSNYYSEADLNRYLGGTASNNGNPLYFTTASTPPWIYGQQTPLNYVEFLAESGNWDTHAQKEISYTNSSSSMSSRFGNMNHHKVSCLVPPNEVAPVNNFMISEDQIPAQNLGEGYCSAASGLPPKLISNLSSQKSAATADRHRRLRIAQRLDALQELLPQQKGGGKASVLDDVIDHIKYLQFQMKYLSQSRLGGESSCTPFIFHEGYGHYLHEQMVDEPLEEMMGKLLEENPLAATQLLESRGLFIMPMTLAEGLRPDI